MAKRESDKPEKLPPQSPSVPGPTYENPNEDEFYYPPEDERGTEADDERKDDAQPA